GCEFVFWPGGLRWGAHRIWLGRGMGAGDVAVVGSEAKLVSGTLVSPTAFLVGVSARRWPWGRLVPEPAPGSWEPELAWPVRELGADDGPALEIATKLVVCEFKREVMPPPRSSRRAQRPGEGRTASQHRAQP